MRQGDDVPTSFVSDELNFHLQQHCKYVERLQNELKAIDNDAMRLDSSSDEYRGNRLEAERVTNALIAAQDATTREAQTVIDFQDDATPSPTAPH